MTLPDRDALLADLQARIGHTFADPALLELALTHSSYAHEHDCPSNERLEFLGDAIVNAVVTRMLYRRFPNLDEGLLSQQKHRLVATDALDAIGRELGLAALMRVGKGARKNEVHRNKSKIEDATEALVGAIHEDAGFDVTANVVEPLFEPLVARLHLTRPKGEEGYKNAVSLLHEKVAKKPLRARAYEVVLGKKGSDHEPLWEIGWWVGGRMLASDWSTSKASARRQAARQSLQVLEELVEAGWVPDREAEPPEDAAS